MNDKNDPYDRAVKNQILKIYPSIKKLYQEFCKRQPGKKEGNIMVDWTIDESSRPERVEVVTSDFNDREFEAWILDEIRKVRFPEPDLKRYVSHTFRFRDEAGRHSERPKGVRK